MNAGRLLEKVPSRCARSEGTDELTGCAHFYRRCSGLLEYVERPFRILPRYLLPQIFHLVEMAVAQFPAVLAGTVPMALDFLGCQIIEVCGHHAKVGCLQQLAIELENAFCALCPLAKWPGLPAQVWTYEAED